LLRFGTLFAELLLRDGGALRETLFFEGTATLRARTPDFAPFRCLDGVRAAVRFEADPTLEALFRELEALDGSLLEALDGPRLEALVALLPEALEPLFFEPAAFFAVFGPRALLPRSDLELVFLADLAITQLPLGWTS
jgi:hypothetical protein